MHVQLHEGHDHTDVDAIGEAVLEHGGEHVAIDVDADLLLQQIALEVRGKVGELTGLAFGPQQLLCWKTNVRSPFSRSMPSIWP